jgi:two-component system LytT family sensor kinase
MNLYDLVFSDSRSGRLRRHMLFWSMWCLYWLTTYLIPTQWIPAWNFRGPLPQIEHYGFLVSIFRIAMNTVLMTMIYMGLTYGIIYFILPRYLSKNKNWIVTSIFLLLFIAAIAFINYLFFILVFSISTRLGYFQKMPDMAFIIPVWGRQILFNYPTVVGLALAIKLLKGWYLKQNETAQVAREKINAELQLLKAQVHPHFLFNTLNNIYSFIINDSAVAPLMLKKLSTLLRYIIYECDQPVVPLQMELNMISDYLDLEKVRYGQSFNMNLQVQGNAFDKSICPLLLIPFLENSFKHGASQMLTHPWVKLDIGITEEDLFFNLSNSKPGSIAETSVAKGLGLSNVKKRLAILYPETHSLTITEDVMSFTVTLKVPIVKREEDEQQFMTRKKHHELV